MKSLQYFTAMIILTVVLGLIYVCVQQVYRRGANDPQVQIAHDLKDALEKGTAPSLVFTGDSVLLERSLAVFKSAYNENGNPVASTGYLNGKIPVPPGGVFDHAKHNEENQLTWQPEPGVRLASVIVRVNHPSIKYVVVGRSLKNVEERVSNLGTMVFIGWMLCMAVLVVNWVVSFYFSSRRNLA